MDLSTRRSNGGGRILRPCQAEDLVARLEEFSDDRGADLTGRAGDENAYVDDLPVLADPKGRGLMSVAVISL